MARGRPYTPEEDAIILSTPVTRDIQQALVGGGFGERSDNAIKQRRNELRKNGRHGVLGPLTRTRPAKDSLTAASAEYETALAHVVRLQAELEAAEQAAENSLKQLRERLTREEV